MSWLGPTPARPYDTQPQDAYRINLSHPSARGLVFAYVGSTIVYDAALGVVGKAVGLAGSGSGPGGKGAYFSSTTGAGVTFSSNSASLGLSREFSMLTAGSPASEASVKTMLSVRSTGGNAVRALSANMDWGAGASAGRLGLFLSNPTGSWYCSAHTSATVVDGKYHVFGASKAAGVNPVLYVDGVVATVNTYLFDGTNPAFLSDVEAVRVGAAQYDPNPNPFTDPNGIPFGFIWNRPLSPQEFRDLSRNPWPLLARVSPTRVSAAPAAPTAVTADQALAYGVRAAATADHTLAYGVRAAATADQALAYGLLNAATADHALSYGVRAEATADHALSYGVLNAATADQALAYGVRSAATADQALAWDVLNNTSVQTDQSLAWGVLNATVVLADQSLVWTALEAVQVDQSLDCAVRSAVTADQPLAWNTLNVVSADQGLAYSVLNTATADQGLAYGVSLGVTADQALEWASTGTVTVDQALEWDVYAGGGSGASASEIAEAVWARNLEGGMTAAQMLRVILAAVSGKTEGIGTDTEVYFARNGTTPRITADFDSAGNRTSVATNGV